MPRLNAFTNKILIGKGLRRRVAVNITLASNITNYLLDPTSVSANGQYIAGRTDVTLTINSGVYVWSNTDLIAGLAVGAFASGDTVSIINNGYIIGKGGNGYVIVPSDYDSAFSRTVNGSPGGPAMNISYPVSITNNSYIAGGGGAGSTRIFYQFSDSSFTIGHGGGGAGGGQGGGETGFLGGTGGGPGQIGGTGASGGGGRILPGVGGAGVSSGNSPNGGGAGGGGRYASDSYGGAASGAGGGGWGASGGSAGGVSVSGAGGSANSPGGASGTGAAGGKAINLNGYTATFLTTGTVWGAVS